MAEFAGASSGFSQVEPVPTVTPFTVHANDPTRDPGGNSDSTSPTISSVWAFKQTIQQLTRPF